MTAPPRELDSGQCFAHSLREGRGPLAAPAICVSSYRIGANPSSLEMMTIPCELPPLATVSLPLPMLRVRTVGRLLPEGAEGTDNPAWLNVVARIGELTGRSGLGEYARLSVSGTLDERKRWLARHASDPLAGNVIDDIVARAMPDMRQQLAGERAKRAALEAELAEHTDAAKAQSAEVATSAREVARLRRELEEARVGQREAEGELSRFRAASGGRSGEAGVSLAGLGIVLEERLALYLCGLLWLGGLWFCWGGLSKLMQGYAGFGDIFSIAFGVIAILIPAVILTFKIVRKRGAMAREQELAG